MTQTSPKKETINALERHLQDRAAISAKEFPNTEKKGRGVSTGYISTKNGGEQKYIVKTALKESTNKKQTQDRLDLAREYTFGKLYERLLYDRAPKIGLVTLGKELAKDPQNKQVRLTQDRTQQRVALRAKFFNNFQLLSEFSGYKGQINGGIISTAPQLKTMEGFEKVIAACLLCGETDYHASNLGVVKGQNGENIVVKIDHGRSGFGLKNNSDHTVSDLISFMQDDFKNMKYNDIPFDPRKFMEAIKEMVKISNDEIENIVKRGAGDLEHIGVNLQNLEIIEKTNKTQNFDPSIRQLSDRIIKQRGIMEELANRLEVICYIDPPTPKNWLEICKNDPIKWAKDNNKTILGRDPTWFSEHRKEIGGTDPVGLAYKQTPELGENALKIMIAQKANISGIDPVVWAINNNKTIDGKSIGEYCRNNKIDMLSHVIEEYQAKPTAKLETEYDVFIGRTPEKGYKTQVLDKLLEEKPTTIARIIDKQIKSNKQFTLTVDTLTQNCGLKTLHKISKIGNIIDTREQNRGIKQSFYDGLNKFVNGVKNIFSKGVTDKKLSSTLNELQELSTNKHADVNKSIEDIQETKKFRQVLGKFTAKIASESHPRLSLQVKAQ